MKLKFSVLASLDMIISNKEIKKRKSGCANAQAGMCIFCLQTPEDRISSIEAKIIANMY